MDKINKLISLCKAGIYIEINNHKNNYQSVDEHFKGLMIVEEDILEDIGEYVYKEMVARDKIIEIQAYPETPIGSYRVFHYDMENAIDLILVEIEK